MCVCVLGGLSRRWKTKKRNEGKRADKRVSVDWASSSSSSFEEGEVKWEG